VLELTAEFILLITDQTCYRTYLPDCSPCLGFTDKTNQ